ncbi:DNA-binding response regulator [Brevibacillus agri]|uniref:DNA-binding response regulator n=1 Tax=Brevibacillus agri TaxID=51101 RepID=A0A3M8BD96_9BACL|nr:MULTISPECIES: response regulator transcription factor [Brevibacillus]ELK40986.1 two-component response regulator [Brevibacillus agri BAB-2500]MBG9566400.1 chemotaxis protein CheY [Brevibacillus agri]MCG5253506.1 response regulator transcription factor [Brevibacillus agri]MDN4095040.1 response regulator transcription factor [Brevibacillus agri]MDR9506227.1 response regulator transcription factor [Brevibacillus agri]
MMPFRVLIADDHPHAREAIKSVLAEHPIFELVDEARDGQHAIQLCRLHQPDLVLMDISMPQCNGLEATRIIKAQYPFIKIVMLSVSDDIVDLFTAIQYGAQGYLLKNTNHEDWISYLQELISGESRHSRKLAGKMLYPFMDTSTSDEPPPSLLTNREQEIAKYVAHGKTNLQIANALSIRENTVKNHIRNILDKLQLENRVQLASYAVRHRLAETDNQPLV